MYDIIKSSEINWPLILQITYREVLNQQQLNSETCEDSKFVFREIM